MNPRRVCSSVKGENALCAVSTAMGGCMSTCKLKIACTLSSSPCAVTWRKLTTVAYMYQSTLLSSALKPANRAASANVSAANRWSLPVD